MTDDYQPDAVPPPEPAPAPAEPAQASLALDRRSIAIVLGVALLLAAGFGAYMYFGGQTPTQEAAEQVQPGETADEQFYPNYEGPLLVRPVTIRRPSVTDAMRASMTSGYADIEFTVGGDGRATNLRVARESAEDFGYAAEAVRVIRGATWPTEWQGHAAPYEARHRVIFPPGRGARTIAPIAISSPNLTPEILALRRNASVTLLVRVKADGGVESASVISSDVENNAVTAEALRVANSARFPPNPADFGYQTQLVVNFNVLGALNESAPPPPGPTVSVGEVPFSQRASASDFDRHYPRRARRDGLEGRVELSCNVRRDRRLDCAIVSEDPPGQGFGQAGLRISRAYRAEGQFPDGRSTLGAHVRVPLVFRLQ